jgi:hypothetical protein
MDSVSSGSSLLQDSLQLVRCDLLGPTVTIDTYSTDINIPIFVVLYVGYKVIHRTKFWKPMEMDFVTVSSGVVLILLPFVDSVISRAFRHQKRPRHRKNLRRISENVLLILSFKVELHIFPACKFSYYVMSNISRCFASGIKNKGMKLPNPRVCGTCPASRRDTFLAVFCG